jgi:hypothetical protein
MSNLTDGFLISQIGQKFGHRKFFLKKKSIYKYKNVNNK